MSKSLSTVWPLEPHTRAKHEILRRYLQAWLPILGKYHERIVYIDGFAGPGLYEGGEPGSPVIALKTALDHAQRISGEVVFLFIENDTDRADSLKGQIATLSLPASFRCDVESGPCAPILSSLLARIEATGGSLAPTFAFLDPFGYSHTPFDLVARILRNQRCEVLITFMYEEINRFISFEQETAHFDELFGCDRWRQAANLRTSLERQNFLRELYRAQLRTVAGARYVHAFEMRNANGRVDYFLYFATNSLLGVKKMKEAMWKVDPAGGYRFSDATDPSQAVLFATEPDPRDIERRLHGQFGHADVTVERIEEFVVSETPYRETHFKKQVLKPLELASPPGLSVIAAPVGRKRGDYPAGTTVRLL